MQSNSNYKGCSGGSVYPECNTVPLYEVRNSEGLPCIVKGAENSPLKDLDPASFCLDADIKAGVNPRQMGKPLGLANADFVDATTSAVASVDEQFKTSLNQ